MMKHECYYLKTRHEKRFTPANLICRQFLQKMWTFWIEMMRNNKMNPIFPKNPICFIASQIHMVNVRPGTTIHHWGKTYPGTPNSPKPPSTFLSQRPAQHPFKLGNFHLHLLNSKKLSQLHLTSPDVKQIFFPYLSQHLQTKPHISNLSQLNLN